MTQGAEGRGAGSNRPHPTQASRRLHKSHPSGSAALGGSGETASGFRRWAGSACRLYAIPPPAAGPLRGTVPATAARPHSIRTTAIASATMESVGEEACADGGGAIATLLGETVSEAHRRRPLNRT